MDKLKQWLLIATILVVGLIPQPDLVVNKGECRTHNSAFLRVTLNYEDCSGGDRMNETVITIPGFLDWRRKVIPALIVMYSENHFYLGILTRSSKNNPSGWWDLIRLGTR